MAMRRVLAFGTVALLVLLLTLPLFAFGASLPGKIVPCDGPKCTVCHLADLANNVLNAGIYIAVFLSAVLFAWAGWKYLTSVGSPGAHEKAKEILVNVLVGLLVILGGWLVIDTIMRTLTTKNKTWNQICNSASIPPLERHV
jgi:hypothetical protein